MAKRIEDNPRSRQFLIELYPDNAEHMKVFLKLNKGYNFVGIKHNRDVYEKERKNEAGEIVNAIGELKKEHMHIIIEFANQRYLNGISKEIGLEKRFIQKVDSFKKVSRYLIHLDNEEKAQYLLDELFGSPDMITKAKKQCTEEQTPTSVCYELLNALDNIDGIVSCGQIARIALCTGQIAVYNRFRSVFADWIYEHNEKYAKGYKADLKLCSRDFEEIC